MWRKKKTKKKLLSHCSHGFSLVKNIETYVHIFGLFRGLRKRTFPWKIEWKHEFPKTYENDAHIRKRKRRLPSRPCMHHGVAHVGVYHDQSEDVSCRPPLTFRKTRHRFPKTRLKVVTFLYQYKDSSKKSGKCEGKCCLFLARGARLLLGTKVWAQS